jgi:DNA replication protein DnaC
MADIEKSIAECCKQLRLSSNFAGLAMTQQGGTPQEYLLNLLTNEIDYRITKRKSKYLNTAGFPRRYTVEQFRADEIDFPDGVNFQSLLKLDFYHTGKNVIMYGGTGTGKTMLSILIGISACNQEIPVKFYRTAGLINLFSESKNKGTLTALKKKLNSAQILILDEFGYVPYDSFGRQSV